MPLLTLPLSLTPLHDAMPSCGPHPHPPTPSSTVRRGEDGSFRYVPSAAKAAATAASHHHSSQGSYHSTHRRISGGAPSSSSSSASAQQQQSQLMKKQQDDSDVKMLRHSQSAGRIAQELGLAPDNPIPIKTKSNSFLVPLKGNLIHTHTHTFPLLLIFLPSSP